MSRCARVQGDGSELIGALLREGPFFAPKPEGTGRFSRLSSIAKGVAHTAKLSRAPSFARAASVISNKSAVTRAPSSASNLCGPVEESVGEEAEAAHSPVAARERGPPSFSASSAFSAFAAPHSKSDQTTASPADHLSSVPAASGASADRGGSPQGKQSRIAEMRRRAIDGKCDNPRCKKVEAEDHKFELRCHKCSRVKYCSKVSAIFR